MPKVTPSGRAALGFLSRASARQERERETGRRRYIHKGTHLAKRGDTLGAADVLMPRGEKETAVRVTFHRHRDFRCQDEWEETQKEQLPGTFSTTEAYPRHPCSTRLRENLSWVCSVSRY